MFAWREIVIEGAAFDVDAAIARSGLQPECAWRRGCEDPRNGKVAATSGLRIEYTPSNELWFDEATEQWYRHAERNERQFEDAATFLRSNGKALREVLGQPGIERAVLSFGLALRPRSVPDAYGHLRPVLPTFPDFRMHVPAEVVSLAGALGFSLVLNVEVVEDWEWEWEGPARRAPVMHHGRSIEFSGRQFDPADALPSHLPAPEHLWRAGVPVPGAPRQLYRDSGVSYAFSAMDRWWVRDTHDPAEVPPFAFLVAPPLKQIEDAAGFLRRHRAGLAQLATRPGVEERTLHFAWPLRPDGTPDYVEYAAMQGLPTLHMLDLVLPGGLVADAGAIGLGIRVVPYSVGGWNFHEPDSALEAVPPDLVEYLARRQPNFVPQALRRVYGTTEERAVRTVAASPST